MSQTAAVRAPRTPPHVARPARSLRVVTGAAPRSHVLLVGVNLALLTLGFVAVLLVNTALAQGTYRLERLQSSSAALTAQAESLSHELEVESSTARLARRATGMGMVESPGPAFLRLSDGKVLGVAKVATAKDRLSVAGGRPATAGAASTRKPATAPKKPKPATPTATPSARPTTPKPAG